MFFHMTDYENAIVMEDDELEKDTGAGADDAVEDGDDLDEDLDDEDDDNLDEDDEEI